MSNIVLVTYLVFTYTASPLNRDNTRKNSGTTTAAGVTPPAAAATETRDPWEELIQPAPRKKGAARGRARRPGVRIKPEHAGELLRELAILSPLVGTAAEAGGYKKIYVLKKIPEAYLDSAGSSIN